MPPAILYRATDLTDYMVRFFHKLGVSQPHAERAAEILRRRASADPLEED